MKYRFLLLVICVIGGLQIAFNQQYEIGDLEVLTDSGVFVQKPVWSPDGQHVLFTGANKKGLYLLDVGTGATETLNHTESAGRNAVWSNNSLITYTKHGEFIKVKINKQKSTGEIGERDLIVSVNLLERKVYAYSQKSGKMWPISEKQANYYNPVLSPDETKVILHEGSKMVVYATDGSGKKEVLGNGIAHSWNKNGDKLFYFLDSSADGHHLSNSEIYVLDIKKKNAKQLTFTNNIHEMWPALSPDGKTLLFTNNLDGRLYRANLLQKKKCKK